jgi:hypothetical protein
MSSVEIRKFITLLESSQETINEQILREVFETKTVNENIIKDIKDKVKSWNYKAGMMTGDVIPSLQNKFKTMTAALGSKLGDDTVDALETALTKKAGTNWMSNAGKIAAAIAVAGSLLSNPAAAQDLATRLGLGIVGGMQYAQTRPGYMPHKDPNVVYGQMSPEQALALQQQQQMSGQQIPQTVMNALVGAAMSQLLYPQKGK